LTWAENEDMPVREIFDDVCRTYPPQDSIFSPTCKQPCTNDVVAHNRCWQRLPPKPTQK